RAGDIGLHRVEPSADVALESEACVARRVLVGRFTPRTNILGIERSLGACLRKLGDEPRDLGSCGVDDRAALAHAVVEGCDDLERLGNPPSWMASIAGKARVACGSCPCRRPLRQSSIGWCNGLRS